MRWRTLRTTLVAALTAYVWASPAPLKGQEQDPWFGSWSQNLAQASAKPDSIRYKRVTCRIEPWEDGLKVVYDMVGIRGGVTHMEWTGRFDGQDYPVQGVDYVLTNAYRRLNDRSYEIVIKLDGAVAATSRVIVSPDRRILSVTTEEKTATGQTLNTTAVYERQ